MKIHEGCGGLVRWVEAVNTPGVGYFGECDHCNTRRLVVEEIVPVELPDGMRYEEFVEQHDPDDYADVYWDEDADWESNQSQIEVVA